MPMVRSKLMAGAVSGEFYGKCVREKDWSAGTPKDRAPSRATSSLIITLNGETLSLLLVKTYVH